MSEKYIRFRSIPRLLRDMVITEKLDGANVQVFINEAGEVRAGGHYEWLTVDEDHRGFAAWVEAHKQELIGMGPGHHFGEWWGEGINRGYGLKERRFSLFNVERWGDGGKMKRPACCHVVPVLYTGPFTTEAVRETLIKLQETGSVAAPGFMRPEGIITYHTASGHLYKTTLDKHDQHKGQE